MRLSREGYVRFVRLLEQGEITSVTPDKIRQVTYLPALHGSQSEFFLSEGEAYGFMVVSCSCGQQRVVTHEERQRYEQFVCETCAERKLFPSGEAMAVLRSLLRKKNAKKLGFIQKSHVQSLVALDSMHWEQEKSVLYPLLTCGNTGFTVKQCTYCERFDVLYTIEEHEWLVENKMLALCPNCVRFQNG